MGPLRDSLVPATSFGSAKRTARCNRRNWSWSRIQVAGLNLFSSTAGRSAAPSSCSITLRRASIQDLAFIVALEQQFRGLNLVGADDLPTHEKRMNQRDWPR